MVRVLLYGNRPTQADGNKCVCALLRQPLPRQIRADVYNVMPESTPQVRLFRAISNNRDKSRVGKLRSRPRKQRKTDNGRVFTVPSWQLYSHRLGWVEVTASIEAS